MPAWRCLKCEIDWPPVARQYAVCPGCERACAWAPLGKPRLDEPDAARLAAEFRFDRYYTEHCRKGGYGVSGSIPDELAQTTIPDRMAV